jgi:hypothetical protein
MPAEPSGPFGEEIAALSQAKKTFLLVAGSAAQKYGDGIKNEQEVLMHLSNMVMEIFAIDTALHRAQKKGCTDIHAAIARTFLNDAISRLTFAATQTLAAVAEGDALRTQMAAVRRLLRWTPVNTVQSRQRIAEHLLDQNRYAL